MQHAFFIYAELKFCIGNDDAALQSVITCYLIKLQTDITNLGRQWLSN
jgi:hypothetical protein